MGAHNKLRDSLSETSDDGHACARSFGRGDKVDGAMLDLEGSLHRAVVAYGAGSEQTCEIATSLVLMYNHVAMKRLSENNIKSSLRLLQKAELLTSRHQAFLGKGRLQARALTLNNTGCLMKKWGKPRESVKLLARALRIEAEVPGSADNPAGTHVNMSAALSALGLHRAAAAHASHAIHLASKALRHEEDAASSIAATDGGGRLDDCVGDADPERMDVGGAASFDPGNENSGSCSGDSCGIGRYGCDRRCFATTAAGESAESGSVHVPIPDVPETGMETGMVSSAVADDGRSPEASSLSSSNDGAGRKEPEHEKRGEEPAAGCLKSCGDGQRVSAEGSNGTAQAESEAPSSAAGALLAIACFNLGVEREHLGQLDAALSSYEDARAAAVQNLGPDNPVATGIGVALEKASDAAVALASESRKRSASRARSAVSSFPSIGKLQFGYKKTPDGLHRVDGRRHSPRRWQQQQQQQHGQGIAGSARSRDLLEQAYTSPRPCPPPPRTDSWARLGRVPSPRSPRAASASAPGVGGPQRSGRWTNANTVATDTPSNRNARPETRESGARCGTDEELRWRALACAEWSCSPREALQAQQAVEVGRGFGTASQAGDGVQR